MNNNDNDAGKWYLNPLKSFLFLHDVTAKRKRFISILVHNNGSTWKRTTEMFEIMILQHKKYRINYLWLPRQISMYAIVFHLCNLRLYFEGFWSREITYTVSGVMVTGKWREISLGDPVREALLWRDVYLVIQKDKGTHSKISAWGLSSKVPLCKGVFSSVEYLHQVNANGNVEIVCGDISDAVFLFLPLDKNTVRPLCPVQILKGCGRQSGRTSKASQGNS